MFTLTPDKQINVKVIESWASKRVGEQLTSRRKQLYITGQRPWLNQTEFFSYHLLEALQKYHTSENDSTLSCHRRIFSSRSMTRHVKRGEKRLKNSCRAEMALAIRENVINRAMSHGTTDEMCSQPTFGLGKFQSSHFYLFPRDSSIDEISIFSSFHCQLARMRRFFWPLRYLRAVERLLRDFFISLLPATLASEIFWAQLAR